MVSFRAPTEWKAVILRSSPRAPCAEVKVPANPYPRGQKLTVHVESPSVNVSRRGVTRNGSSPMFSMTPVIFAGSASSSRITSATVPTAPRYAPLGMSRFESSMRGLPSLTTITFPCARGVL